MWVEHIKCELVESIHDPEHLKRILDALLLFASLELMPDEVEDEIFQYIDQLSQR